MKKFLKFFSIFLSFIFLIIISLVAVDIFNDRKHSVEITGTTYLLEKAYPFGYIENNSLIQVLTPKDKVKVLRITYGKDFMAIKVQSNEGKVGWIIHGEGSFRIYDSNNNSL